MRGCYFFICYISVHTVAHLVPSRIIHVQNKYIYYCRINPLIGCEAQHLPIDPYAQIRRNMGVRDRQHVCTNQICNWLIPKKNGCRPLQEPALQGGSPPTSVGPLANWLDLSRDGSCGSSIHEILTTPSESETQAKPLARRTCPIDREGLVVCLES